MQTRCFSRTRHPALIAPSRPSITHPRIRSCCLPLADSSLIGNPMIPVVLAVVLLLVSVIVYRFVWVPYSIVRKLRAQGLKVKSPESRVLVSSSFPPPNPHHQHKYTCPHHLRPPPPAHAHHLPRTICRRNKSDYFSFLPLFHRHREPTLCRFWANCRLCGTSARQETFGFCEH